MQRGTWLYDYTAIKNICRHLLSNTVKHISLLHVLTPPTGLPIQLPQLQIFFQPSIIPNTRLNSPRIFSISSYATKRHVIKSLQVYKTDYSTVCKTLRLNYDYKSDEPVVVMMFGVQDVRAWFERNTEFRVILEVVSEGFYWPPRKRTPVVYFRLADRFCAAYRVVDMISGRVNWNVKTWRGCTVTRCCYRLVAMYQSVHASLALDADAFRGLCALPHHRFESYNATVSTVSCSVLLHPFRLWTFEAFLSNICPVTRRQRRFSVTLFGERGLCRRHCQVLDPSRCNLVIKLTKFRGTMGHWNFFRRYAVDVTIFV